MSIDLGRLLIAAGVVSPPEVEAALFLAVLRGISFPRALVDRGTLSERVLEDELDRMGGLALRQVIGSRELFARLPRAMCRRLAAVPTRHDPLTSLVDVAAADPLDPHIPAEFGFHLGLPVRVVRAPISVVEEAIRGLELDDKEPAMGRARPRRVTPAFPHGAPQSSIPPPPLDDVPIPLVRRTSMPALNSEALPLRHTKTERPPVGANAHGRPASPLEREPRTPRTSQSSSASSVPPDPLAEPKALTPRTPRRATLCGGADFDGKREPRPPGASARPPVLRASPIEPPAVSFPSSPPASLAADDSTNAEAPRAPLAASVPAERIAALKAPALPEITIGLIDAARDPVSEAPSTPVPATLRHGRIALGRPTRPITIPAPGADPMRSPASSEGQVAWAREPEDLAGLAVSEAGSGRAPGDIAPLTKRRGTPRPGTIEAVRKPTRGSATLRPGPPTFQNMTQVFAALDMVRTRDDVVRVTLQGLRLLARRVAVFVTKRGAFHGYACNAEFGDEHALRNLAIPMDQPSLLATATATSVYLGPVPGTPTHAPLLDIMENPTLDVAAVAVRVSGRVVMVLVADGLGDPHRGAQSMDELARIVGDALTRILAIRQE